MVKDMLKPRKFRCIHLEVFLGKGVLKCDFNKVADNFIEITVRQGCFIVNLLHISRTPFLKNTSGRLILKVGKSDEVNLSAL